MEELIGRITEIKRLKVLLELGKNVLLEGPVGVGKTAIALYILAEQNRKYFRIDGDQRFSEQKLTGWFDPNLLLEKGYQESSFIAGPLTEAMQSGSVLFINELNRLPEGVQNVLLPAIDEGLIQVPKLGVIQAKPGFQVIATQNPKEFVATTHLSEAILDRFELVYLDYQSKEEEIKIVRSHVKEADLSLVETIVDIVRSTRVHSGLKRGASVRASISVTEIATRLIAQGMNQEEALFEALLMGLMNRIEIAHSFEPELTQDKRVKLMLQGLLNQKKKNPNP